MQSWLVWLGVCFGPILAVYPTQTEMPFRIAYLLPIGRAHNLHRWQAACALVW